ncbi:aldo-keto reductase AKR2E4-like [Achroia grisella]|uniref:aldo-keto reductase AKR2E4-like n=1 Tax=Achroia grisella TaxID=688607 RepID=UPI0027D2A6BD|nr:aldo-keto reductase AKR2E4-like [Achroia grisella]
MAAGQSCILAFVFIAYFHVAKSTGVAPNIKLNDGREIPSFGLGTWLGLKRDGTRVQVNDDSVEKAVEYAIDAGYRHIDTAHIYNTEDQVGRAINNKIKEGVIKREDIFVTTKLWNSRHAKEDVVPALKESLKQLNLDYIDLYLIHWPIGLLANGSFDTTDNLQTWQGMIEARDQGLAKSIGVSNFNEQQLDRLISLSHVTPAVLQVEINLNLQQPSLLAYCRQHNITVTGYTPFGSLFPSKAVDGAPPPRVDDPALVEVGNKYNKTVPQITLRYLIELGIIPIPKSTTKSRIEQNLALFDFTLTQKERDLLKSYDTGYRTIPVLHWIQHPYYPFEKKQQ